MNLLLGNVTFGADQGEPHARYGACTLPPVELQIQKTAKRDVRDALELARRWTERDLDTFDDGPIREALQYRLRIINRGLEALSRLYTNTTKQKSGTGVVDQQAVGKARSTHGATGGELPRSPVRGEAQTNTASGVAKEEA